MTLTVAQRALAVASLFLLACCAIFFYYYLENQGKKAALAAELSSLQTTVARINAERQAPEASDPLLHSPAFPRDPPDLALATSVLASATGSGVSTGPIQTTAGADETVGNETYRATVVNLTISGSLPRILNFFDRMEQAGIRTLAFDNMRVEADNGNWTVQVQVIAYSQQP